MLCLYNDDDIVISGCDIIGKAKTITVSSCQADTAASGRCVSSKPHHVSRLFGCVDLRYDDSLRSKVQYLLDLCLIADRDTDDAGDAVTDSLENAKNIGSCQRSVFAIDKQPVKTDVRKNLGR